MKRRFLALLLLLLGFAHAQDAALPSLDPSRLGADIFALGGVVLLVVQFIKRQVERARPGVPPWAWWAVSLGLAEAAAAGLFYANFGATFGELPAPWGWLTYGLLSGLVASGFKDLVMGLKKGSPAPSRPAAPPDPARPDSAAPAPRSGMEGIR